MNGTSEYTYLFLPPVTFPGKIYLTLNIISLSDYSVIPEFYLSNTTTIAEPTSAEMTRKAFRDGSSGNADPMHGETFANVGNRKRNPDVWLVKTHGGFGNWTGYVEQGAVLGVNWFNETGEVEVGLSTGGEPKTTLSNVPCSIFVDSNP